MDIEILPFEGVRVAGALIEFGLGAAAVHAVLREVCPDLGRHLQCSAPGFADFRAGDPTEVHAAWLEGAIHDPPWALRVGRSGLGFAGGGVPRHRDELSALSVLPEAGGGDALVWDGIDLLAEPLADILACLPGARWQGDRVLVAGLGIRVGTWPGRGAGARLREVTWFDRSYGSWTCCEGTFACAAGGTYDWWGPAGR